MICLDGVIFNERFFQCKKIYHRLEPWSIWCIWWTWS